MSDCILEAAAAKAKFNSAPRVMGVHLIDPRKPGRNGWWWFSRRENQRRVQRCNALAG
jgi:hypothetical protein